MDDREDGGAAAAWELTENDNNYELTKKKDVTIKLAIILLTGERGETERKRE